MPLLAAPTLNAATLPPQMREALEPFRRTLERFGRDASAAVGASIQYDDNLELYSASITTPDPWVPLTFQNGWSAFAPVTLPTPAPSVMKDVNGRVWLRGGVKGGTVGLAASTVAATFCPSLRQLRATAGDDAFARMNVTAAGDIVPVVGTGAAYFALDCSWMAADPRPWFPSATAGGYPIQWLSSVRGVVQNVVCWQAAELVAGAEVRSMLPCVWDTASASDGRTQINVRTVPGLNPLTAYNLVFAVFGR